MTGAQLGLGLDRTQKGEVIVDRITLPYLPPSKNVYDGWQPAWKSGAKKKWIRDIAAAADEHQLPRGLRKVGLAARLVFASKGRRDTQNYAQTLWHFVPDALVRCDVLVDDRAGMIQWGPNFGIEFAYDTRQEIPKKKRQRTIITIAYRVEEYQCIECLRNPYGRCDSHRLHRAD